MKNRVRNIFSMRQSKKGTSESKTLRVFYRETESIDDSILYRVMATSSLKRKQWFVVDSVTFNLSHLVAVKFIFSLFQMHQMANGTS